MIFWEFIPLCCWLCLLCLCSMSTGLFWNLLSHCSILLSCLLMIYGLARAVLDDILDFACIIHANILQTYTYRFSQSLIHTYQPLWEQRFHPLLNWLVLMSQYQQHVFLKRITQRKIYREYIIWQIIDGIVLPSIKIQMLKLLIIMTILFLNTSVVAHALLF